MLDTSDKHVMEFTVRYNDPEKNFVCANLFLDEAKCPSSCQETHIFLTISRLKLKGLFDFY